MVFAINATDSQLKVAALLNWKSPNSTGSIPFKMAPLAPEETRVVDLASLKGSGLPSDAYWANVELTYSGKIGDLVPLAASYDETTRYGVQSPFSDSISFLWKGGMWHVDGQHNTLITTGNSIENDKPAEVAIKLFYGTSGVYELPTTVLAPGKQTWVDVGKLIRDQVPDRNGQLLPPGVMEGSYEIKDIKNHQVGYLYEGKLIADKTFGHATYGCALCCEYGGVGYDGFYLTPNPLYGTVGGAGQYNAYALNQCTGVDDPVDAYSYSSSNTSVATVTTVGHVAYLTPGTSTVTGFAKLQSVQNPSCRPQTYQAPAPTNVGPKITSISPPRGLIGNSVAVTINGSGFDGANLSVSAGSGISVSITSHNSQQIQAQFVIAQTANGGNQNVTVNASGQPSNPSGFYVQIPKTLIRDSTYGTNGLSSLVTITNGSVLDIYGNVLLTNECGMYRNIGYLLVDQETSPQTIQGDYTLVEHFDNYTTTIPGQSVPPDQDNPIVYAQTRLGDTQFIGIRSPNCPGSNDHEGFDQHLTVKLDSSHSYGLSIVNHIDRGKYSGVATVNVTIETP